jgi:phosphoribosylaminoimidazole-succinocarboxamide synthase
MEEDTVLIKHGKVKDFYLFRGMEPTQEAFGSGYQTWPDDFYSLFDYGRFPQKIPGKAGAMYKETVHFFDLLEDAGIPHHMIEDMSNIKIKVLVARIPPSYDWIEPGKTATYLIPVEVVFSQWVTPVASLHERLRKGTEDPAKYGLKHPPERGETVVLKEPKITLSTKIETTDKYEAEIKKDLLKTVGLVGNEPESLKHRTLQIYRLIQKDVEDTGLIVADGKLEYALSPHRNLYAVDSCLTWDENRILYRLPDGRYIDLSKQFPRNIYTINGYKSELKKAQKASPEDKSKWPAPPLLSDEQMGIVISANDAVRAGLLRESGADRKLKKAARKALEELDRLKEKYHRDETGRLL